MALENSFPVPEVGQTLTLVCDLDILVTVIICHPLCFARPPIPSGEVVRADGSPAPQKPPMPDEKQKTPPLPPKARNSIGSKPVGVVAPFNINNDVSFHLLCCIKLCFGCNHIFTPQKAGLCSHLCLYVRLSVCL